MEADGLTPLLDAVLAVAEDMELEGVLDRVVEAARTMVGAQYAALGVLSPDGESLAQFRHAGIDPETADRIGPLPTGHGLLGTVIRTAEPISVDDLAAHPDSTALPPGHPPMRSFLGVPIRIGSEVFGNLYLTEKPGGFTDHDRFLVEALAAVASTEIRNATAAEQLRTRERVGRAVADVATTALGGAPASETAELTLRAAVRLVGGSGELQDHGPGLPPGEVVRVDDELHIGLSEQGHGLTVRLPTGIILDPSVVEAVEELSRHAAVALAYATARSEVQRLAVVAERDRIARDLHDTVIQRVFGAGLRLDALGRRLDDRPQDAAIVEELLGELDAVIAELRATIGELHGDVAQSLDDRLHAVVTVLEPVCPGLRPLVIEGDTSRIGSHVAEELPPVLREAITNAARHARASSVEPRLTVTDDSAELTVSDDGVGVTLAAQDGRAHLGLQNLVARATHLGGECELAPREPGGAVLRWTVPLEA